MSPLYPLAILGRLVTPSAAYWMLMPGQCVSEAEGVVEVGVGVRMGVGVEVGVGVGVGVGVTSSELPPTNVWCCRGCVCQTHHLRLVELVLTLPYCAVMMCRFLHQVRLCQ